MYECVCVCVCTDTNTNTHICGHSDTQMLRIDHQTLKIKGSSKFTFLDIGDSGIVLLIRIGIKTRFEYYDFDQMIELPQKFLLGLFKNIQIMFV